MFSIAKYLQYLLKSNIVRFCNTFKSITNMFLIEVSHCNGGDAGGVDCSLHPGGRECRG